MPTIVQTALVSHSASEMYTLVSDVESYPQFLPWCDTAQVTEQTDQHQVASLTIDRRMKGISFTTHNTLSENESIGMQLVDGPFRKLHGVWRFEAIDDSSCKVELSMDFEFKSRVFGALMGPAFTKICDTMVAAFVKRADQIH
mgnify:CR=1 FL=1